ncbi:YceI family protein [Rhizosaccharibacter radicis]|uniref:YceI family protein n=1 Tax=Rhizosaccharibacter radicis TaxID=2782605 RepID=A0ABT1VSG7_9PROT|nr:YceI family protein [Acetobacteraceae bacterium KSS12]
MSRPASSPGEGTAPDRYGAVAQLLHWLIALLILGNLLLGWRMGTVHGAAQFRLFQLHKSFGITVLLLSLLRLGWRLGHRPPPLPAATPAVEAAAAHAVHWLFYGLMILMPLSGWALVSVRPHTIPTLLYGVIPWPFLPGLHGMAGAAQHRATLLAGSTHYWLAWGMVALAALHVGGALKHQFAPEGAVLPRMLFHPRDAHIRRPGAFLLAVPLAALAVALLAGQALVGPETGAPVTGVAATTPRDAAGTFAPDWVLDQASSRLGFVATVNNESVSGRFDRWDARIRFDPDHPDAARVMVRIDPGSARTGDDTRDQMLPTSDWFDRATFPDASFGFEGARALGGGRFEAEGMLAIRGTSRPVTLVFTLAVADGVAHVTGTLPIDRRTFGVGQGQWAGTDSVAATVEVRIDLRARRAVATP